jgi:hypothetical protein
MAGEASVITRYEKSAADLREMGPLLKLVQDARSGTDMEKMLRALGALPLEHVDIQSIQMNGRHDAFQMQITGTIHAETFENRHNTFHVLLHNLREKAMKTVFSQRMDLKNGQFQIELRNGTP